MPDSGGTLDDVKTLMHNMVRVFRTGDVSHVERIIAEDYLDHQGLGEGAMHGPAGFRQVVGAARAAYKNLTVEIQDLIAEGDRAAARIRWRGVRSSDGAVFTRETIDIVRFAHGRAVEHWGMRLWVDAL